MTSDLKQRIVEAATKSFSLFGYKATTMDQVARIAEVGKGTIYTFFTCKEYLFTHILNTLIQEMKRDANASIQAGAPFFANLERAFHAILSYRKQHEMFVKLSQELRDFGTHAVKDGLQKVEDAIVQYIAKHIADGIDSGNVKPCNSEVVAFMMLRTYTALVFDWERGHTRITDEEITRVFQLVFADGLDQRV